MDRSKLSAAIIGELTQLFTETLERNVPKLLESDLDGIEQRLQEISRGVFGPVVEQVVQAIAQAESSQRPRCPQCHRPMRLVDAQRVRQLQGLVGDYTIARPYFRCESCHQGCCPLDARLGLGPGALSSGLARVACRLGIDDAFDEAGDALRETLGVELSGEALRRVTEGIGAVAEAEAQAAITLAEAGKEPLAESEVQRQAQSPTLLVEVDGAMVHETDGQWHEVKSGLAAPLGPAVQVDKETGRQVLRMGKPSYCAGFESAESLWYRVYVEACRQGLGTRAIVRVVLLGDGAEWIWHYGRRFLAVEVGATRVLVLEILDIYHAFEHLETIASAVFGQGSPKAKAWVEPLKRRLETEGANPILKALGELQPEEPGAADDVRKAIDYFTEHAPRMDYPSFVAQKLPIGSGAIESTCKTLIEKREKGAGMRWSEVGAQQVATLRALHRSGRWQAFWKTHPQCRRPPAYPTDQAANQAA
jgi:hypothetical protein